MDELKNKSIVLMGCKHCGKSTQGKLLAQKLGYDFFDTDDVVAQISGMSARDLYKSKGPAAFFQAEEEACNKIIGENEGKNIVIATGGGICDNAPALQALRSCEQFVFLKLDIKNSVSRITDKIKEPVPGYFENVPAYILKHYPKSMQDIRDILTNIFNERYSKYQNMADVTVDIKNAPIEENFKSLLGALSIKN